MKKILALVPLLGLFQSLSFAEVMEYDWNLVRRGPTPVMEIVDGGIFQFQNYSHGRVRDTTLSECARVALQLANYTYVDSYRIRLQSTYGLGKEWIGECIIQGHDIRYFLPEVVKPVSQPVPVSRPRPVRRPHRY